MVNRRTVLAAGALGTLPGAWAPGTAARPAHPRAQAPRPAPPTPVAPPVDAAHAVARLREGNARWAGGGARHPDASTGYREELAGRQAPFAVVFGCIDSRVPPELVFDQGLGDLLVVRTAAHTLDRLVCASLEYGPAELATSLLLVLGHQRCGAVTAAVQALRDGVPLPGHLAAVARDLWAPYQAVLERGTVREGASDSPEQRAALIEAVIREQIRQTVDRLRADELFAPALAAGRLAVSGGYYALDTGAVALDA